MKEQIINNTINLINRNKVCSDTDLKIYRYGMECIYTLITKTLVVFLISIIIGTTKEFLLLLIFYALLRSYAFGIHASSNIACWISTITIYIGGSIFIKYLTIPKSILAITWMVTAIFFILWAPADTPKRPILKVKKRRKLKIKSLIVIAIYYLLIYFINNQTILNALFLSMVLEGSCICPLLYKILKTPFNNYINYKKGLN
ncbi:MAG: accessory gene regulator B family protein [Bacilli bacterium]|nr:accessory gene regulator B family protein [Bacilli bacterium]